MTAYRPGALLVAIASLAVARAHPAPAAPAPPARATDAIRRPAIARPPIHFEANVGQTDPRVRFVGRGNGYGVFLTATEAVLSLRPRADGRPEPAVVRMRLAGARPDRRVRGEGPIAGRINYYVGDDPTRWHVGVPAYATVRYADVYPGIDLLYHGAQGRLEYDFVVAPGADPRAITLEFEGADALDVDADGNLLLRTAAGTVQHDRPRVHEERDGVRRAVAGGWVVKDARRVGFEVARSDARAALVIDPVVRYAGVLGGIDVERAHGVVEDPQGNVYVVGQTGSPDFPTTPGAPQPTAAQGDLNAFVSKLAPDGSTLLFSTYLGGGPGFLDAAFDVAVDDFGNAYVTGETDGGFPLLFPAQLFGGGSSDGFVTKLGAAGQLVYSTYLGGRFEDAGRSIAVDDFRNAYVTGRTESDDFPTTTSAFQRERRAAFGEGDAFVTVLSSSGSAVRYSTYLGGSRDEDGRGIAVLGTAAFVTGATTSTDFPRCRSFLFGSACVKAFQESYQGGGADAFVTRVETTENGNRSLVYSTYLGGRGTDEGNDIVVDSQARPIVVGLTGSLSFPLRNAFDTTNVVNEGFVTKLDASGSSLVFSSFLGGSSTDVALAVALERNTNAWVTGSTISTDFPTAGGPFQPAYGGGNRDAIVMKVGPTGTLLFSSFLGGTAIDEGRAIGAGGTLNVYVAGDTSSQDFPIVGTPFQGVVKSVDAFVMKLEETRTTAPAPGFSASWSGVSRRCNRSPVRPHCLVKGTLDVLNPGTAPAPESVVRFWRSADDVYDESDVLLEEVRLGPLQDGRSRPVGVEVLLEDSAAGEHLIAVVDATDVVPEIDERNNVVVSPPLP